MSNVEIGLWTHKNRKPDQQIIDLFEKEIPVCPNFQLIKICSDLVGPVSENLGNGYTKGIADRDEFCGSRVIVVDSVNLLSGYRFKGETSTPVAACRETYLRLKEQVQFMKKEISVDIHTYESAKNSPIISPLELKTIVDSHVENIKFKSKQIEIMNRWRQVIFENCFVSGVIEEELKKHFKVLKSEHQISNETVKKLVSAFLDSLNANVVGYENGKNVTYTTPDKAVKYCKQSPERHETGIYS